MYLSLTEISFLHEQNIRILFLEHIYHTYALDVRSGYKNTDRKDVRTFFKTFFRGFFLPKFQIFCQCSDFLSIGYYHKQANTFCCYHFSPSSASVLISCEMVEIISKRYLLLPINSVSDTFYRRSYYVLLPRPFMTDMFCSDTFCSAIRFVAIRFVPIRFVPIRF